MSKRERSITQEKTPARPLKHIEDSEACAINALLLEEVIPLNMIISRRNLIESNPSVRTTVFVCYFIIMKDQWINMLMNRYITFGDLMSLSMTCKSFYRIIAKSIDWNGIFNCAMTSNNTVPVPALNLGSPLGVPFCVRSVDPKHPETNILYNLSYMWRKRKGPISDRLCGDCCRFLKNNSRIIPQSWILIANYSTNRCYDCFKRCHKKKIFKNDVKQYKHFFPKCIKGFDSADQAWDTEELDMLERSGKILWPPNPSLIETYIHNISRRGRRYTKKRDTHTLFKTDVHLYLRRICAYILNNIYDISVKESLSAAALIPEYDIDKWKSLYIYSIKLDIIEIIPPLTGLSLKRVIKQPRNKRNPMYIYLKDE